MKKAIITKTASKSLNQTCLGIETTAHTFGASIVKNKKVLSNVKLAVQTTEGGMIPYQVGVHHLTVCQKIVQEALDKANIQIKDVDVISFSQSPGMGHALRVGAICARMLAITNRKPIVGVNHCIAHLEIGQLLTPAKDPILCYVSGANTQIIGYEGKRYRIFGETLDIGIGHLLDSIARDMGLGFPGGPKIAELAKKCDAKDYIELPYAVKGMDVSFGGIQTFVRGLLAKGVKNEVIAYSLQETVFAMIVEVTERALAHCSKTEVLLGGGVACNTRLQEMMKKMCEERGAISYALENQYNVDNAAMIAWHGLQVYVAQGGSKPEKLPIDPYLRTDEVQVTWR